MDYVILQNENYEKWKHEVLEIINKCHPENKEYLLTIPEKFWHQDFMGENEPMDSVTAYFEVGEYDKI